METSKVKSVQSSGTYTSKYDSTLMYTYEIELEDGTLGEVSCKSENRWKEGDEVEYTISMSSFGSKLKLSKPGASGTYKNNSRPANGDLQARIDASWSIGQAIAILSSLPPGVSMEKWLSDVDDVSTMILNLRNTKL